MTIGKGTEYNSKYGWSSPLSGKSICGAISATADNNPAGEIRVVIVRNGNDMDNYELTKLSNAWSNHTFFQTPLDITAGDRIK